MGSSEAAQVITIVVSGLAGLLAGSFLNVVVYRVPLRMSVVQPPSHCPTCEARLTVIDLVPVASWVWLRGRCRHCHARVSLRYPLVELATGALCAATAGVLGTVWPLPSVAIVLLCALGAAVVDADDAAVPGAFAVVAALASLTLVPIAAALGHADRIGWAALGLLLASLAAIVGDRTHDAQRWVRIAILASLGWAAGWLWPGGGPFVAAWIVVAAAATGLGSVRRPPLAMLAAGSLVAVVASALISRP